jgi:hypothetical protein
MHGYVISRRGISDLSCKRLESRGWRHSLAIRCHLRLFAQPVLLQTMHPNVTCPAMGAYAPANLMANLPFRELDHS